MVMISSSGGNRILSTGISQGADDNSQLFKKNSVILRTTNDLIPKGYIGSENVLLGYDAGANLTTGAENVLIGPQTGQRILSGSKNILIGSDTG